MKLSESIETISKKGNARRPQLNSWIFADSKQSDSKKLKIFHERANFPTKAVLYSRTIQNISTLRRNSLMAKRDYLTEIPIEYLLHVRKSTYDPCLCFGTLSNWDGGKVVSEAGKSTKPLEE